MQFANVAQGTFTAWQDLEELRVGIPEFPLDQLLESSGLLAPGSRKLNLAVELGDSGNRQRIAVLVAVDGRPAPTATDRDLHAIIAVLLPKQSGFIEVLFFPRGIISDEIGQELFGQSKVAQDKAPCIERVGRPETVFSRLASFAKPESRVVLQVSGVMEPAAFVKMVTCGTVNGIKFAAPRDVGQKLCNNESIWCRLDMFSKRPPTKVVDLLQVFIRAFEQRYILGHPGPCSRIRNMIGHGLAVELVEVLDVVAEGSRLQ